MLNSRNCIVLLSLAASASSASTPCFHSGARFDAMECVTLARPSVAGREQLVFQNRCAESVAILVAACELTAHPSCKSDPLRSRGWAIARGIEFLQGTQARTQAVNLRLSGLRPMVLGPPRASRAQVVACRLSTDSSISRLGALKHAVDVGQGQSLRAVLRNAEMTCTGQ